MRKYGMLTLLLTLIATVCMGQGTCGYPAMHVTIKTSEDSMAGTNDDIYIYFGGTTAPRSLDNSFNNDFEAGNTDEFTLTVNFEWCDIAMVGLGKSPDPLASLGGWIMEGMAVEWIDPTGQAFPVYENWEINQDFNGYRGIWKAPDFVAPCQEPQE
jgi:hypothetical protein